MEKIKSFQLDHNTHKEGFYLSGTSNDIFTYDLRFKKPNDGDFIDNASLHTIEHIFATVIRNSEIKDNVVYFGPMGCRTGFYLLLRGIDYAEAKNITVKCMKKCLNVDEIPGSKEEECGNYLEHDLTGAKSEITRYLSKL